MSIMRTRWAAVGAAIATTLGAGGIAGVQASLSSGDRAVYVPITPCRLIDTRPEFQVGTRSTPLGPAETITLNTYGSNGQCTLPGDFTGIVLNVTAVAATQPTFLTIWPTGATQPNASSLNPQPGAPPTPNAVTSKVSATGQFNVYNLQGTVHILADIVGYYVDHTHDDRYYTKTEIAHRSTWISIDPIGVNHRDGASVGTGFGINGGLLLPGGPADVPAFEFGFSMPPDYTSGTDVTVQILWHINQTGCTVNLSNNYVSIDHYGFVPEGTSFGFRTTDPVPRTANQVARSTFIVRSALLAPGDSVIAGLYRSFNSDTCSQPLHIKGIRILYD